MRYKVLHLEWVDSSGFDGSPWTLEDEMHRQVDKHGALNCTTVGFLVRETPTVVVIAQSYAEGIFGHPIAIPKVSITKRKVILHASKK